MIYKRGKIYWYEFEFNGDRVRKSTRQRNQSVALQMESASRTALAKGEVGIVEKKRAPTLAEFGPRFSATIETVCADKPATVGFYKEKLRRLLAYAPLSSARLDRIDEALIDAYKQHRAKEHSRYDRPLAPASINRELATLRRLLRLAQEWNVIDRVPRVRLLRGERNREFVLSYEQEDVYLASLPQPLRDIATLILDTGLRVGEARTLVWTQVYLEPAASARFGYLHISGGKSKYAKRNLSLTGRVSKMLKARRAEADNGFVFPGETGAPVLGTSLDHQHENVREKLKLSTDFVIHSLRHTFGTRLGEAGADAFTIMKLMGHSSVTVSQRYVHPSPESMERAFDRLEALNAVRHEDARKKRENEKVPTISPTVVRKPVAKVIQVTDSKVRALSSAG